MISRLKYRIWQFWQSMGGSLDLNEWLQIEGILSQPELDLFKQLPVPDQNHSLRVLENLTLIGETEPALLKAALLHDLGKIKYPLQLWERVFAVLVRGFFPRLHQKWGEGDPAGIGRALVIIRQHAEWGADLAAEAGSGQIIVWLIRNHEKQPSKVTGSAQDLLLLDKLQTADNQS